jgi:uncharacterized YccA/Bax inhibitor family protein
MKIHTFSDFVALEGGILLCIIFSAALLAIAAFSLAFVLGALKAMLKKKTPPAA